MPPHTRTNARTVVRKKQRPKASSMKVFLGLMLAEETNCRRVGVAVLLLLLFFLGLWVLPGTNVLWRFLLVMQATVRYRTGLFGGGGSDNGEALGGIYGVSEESLDTVYRNLKMAWERATE